jgi:hypothetical protein
MFVPIDLSRIRIFLKNYFFGSELMQFSIHLSSLDPVCLSLSTNDQVHTCL